MKSPSRKLPRLSTSALLACLAVVPACGGPGGSSGEGEGAEDISATDPTGDAPAGCIGNARGTLSASASSVGLGAGVTLTWHVTRVGCSNAVFRLNGTPVAQSGSRFVTPLANATYSLTAAQPGSSTTVFLGTVSVSVTLPNPVIITANDQRPTLLQALGTPGTYIDVQSQVDMDMSNVAHASIAGGVTLHGGRTPRNPGPRLRTSTRPGALFDVAGDGVRITGLRLEGPDMGVPSDGGAVAISASSVVSLDVSGNEISGWTAAGVRVVDPNDRIDYVTNPGTVHIHDNYIHHNQHEGRLGYGVVISDGAYALIERNVFDWNRHAIAGDGSDGSGYRAYDNLVLQHGGLHRWLLGVWTHTHQFDMHGQESCGVGAALESVGSWLGVSDDPTVFNCGTAGHDMSVLYNTFLYHDGAAVKLRGTPELSPYGAFVDHNVFADDDLGDAVEQTESGLQVGSDNQTGVDASGELGTCDFDADGVNDSFMATGATWWFSSRGTGPWSFLNRSKGRLSQVSLGYVDADPRCDVTYAGTVYGGGRPPSTKASTGIITKPVGATLAR
jgi:hypothetical protein